MSKIKSLPARKDVKPADCWDQVAKFGFYRKRDIFGIPRDSDFSSRASTSKCTWLPCTE